MSESEQDMLSAISAVIYYLAEPEPSRYSQSMARQYAEDVRRILLEKQEQQ
jgi:hypothetical protein